MENFTVIWVANGDGDIPVVVKSVSPVASDRFDAAVFKFMEMEGLSSDIKPMDEDTLFIVISSSGGVASYRPIPPEVNWRLDAVPPIAKGT